MKNVQIKRSLTVKEMLDSQDMLNENTIANWRTRLSVADYNMAIVDEIAELIKSGRQWTWWKLSKGVDKWNEKIEIIDVLHFYLSKMILSGFDGDINGYFGNNLGLIPNNHIKVQLIRYDDSFNSTNFMEIVNLLLDVDVDELNVEAMNVLIKSFGMSSEDVSCIYTLKLTLNGIRQQNGYSKGEYEKIKNGVEDNVILEEYYNMFVEDTTMDLETVANLLMKRFEPNV